MRFHCHVYIFKNISNKLFLPVKSFDPSRKLLEIDIFFVNEERFTYGTIPEHLKERLKSQRKSISASWNYAFTLKLYSSFFS